MKNVFVYTKKEDYIGNLSGIVTVPSGFDPAKEKLPVILFLHGAGESGDGTEKTVEKVRAHGIPKYFAANPDYMGQRVITLSPQCVDGYIWDQLTLQLKDWLDGVVKELNGDTDRISITGLSMGGYGTWNMITTFPDYFHRAAPICGGGVSWRINESLSGKEIWVFHSVDDDSVPYNCSVDMASHAIAAGANVKFTTYSNEGHGCWSAAYEKTELIKWLCE